MNKKPKSTNGQWVLVEDTRGWWFREFTGFFNEFICIDQTMCAIYYREASKIMHLKDISSVLPVHELNPSSGTQWKLYLQDTEQYQEWVLSFPTQNALLAWIDHLGQVMKQAECTAITHELVVSERQGGDKLKQVRVVETPLQRVKLSTPRITPMLSPPIV